MGRLIEKKLIPNIRDIFQGVLHIMLWPYKISKSSKLILYSGPLILTSVGPTTVPIVTRFLHWNMTALTIMTMCFYVSTKPAFVKLLPNLSIMASAISFLKGRLHWKMKTCRYMSTDTARYFYLAQKWFFLFQQLFRDFFLPIHCAVIPIRKQK